MTRVTFSARLVDGRRLESSEALQHLRQSIEDQALAMLRAAAAPANDVSTYELEFDDDTPRLVLPASLGADRVLEELEGFQRKLARRRGPRPEGPDAGWDAVVQQVALDWLELGKPPTQRAVADVLGYSDLAHFGRAIKPVGWTEIKTLALVQLAAWYRRLIDNHPAPPDGSEAALRAAFEAIMQPVEGVETPA